ncbi:hypothetical protein PS2_019114 [Malus domestica]
MNDSASWPVVASKNDFNDWQGEVILWASIIEVSEVYANTYLSRFLKDYDDIGDPLGVLHLSNEACFDQLVNLGFDLRDELGSIASLSLLYWSRSRLDCKMMHNNDGVEAGHFLVGPSKDVLVL